MSTKQELIKLSVKKYNATKKKNDFWIWFLAGLLIFLGLSLAVFSLVMLIKSYSDYDTPLAGYAGGIGGGFALILGGVTQIFLFVHRLEDEKNSKLIKTEHDYTNFFIKNYDFNEIVSIVLRETSQKLSISFEQSESNIIVFKYDHAIPNIQQLRIEYLTVLANTLARNKVFSNILEKKYNLKLNGTISDLEKLVSSFDTEVKKTIASIDKILQNHNNGRYSDEFFDYNLKDKIAEYINVLVPYLLIIIKDNSWLNSNVDLFPFVFYYIVKKEE